MNRNIGLQLVIYSLLLAGLSYITYHLSPAWGQTTLIVGLAGGGLCLVWGLKALARRGGKALPILTLIPVLFVLLSQAVLTWGGGAQALPGRSTAALLITVLFALSLAMLMRIAYSGAFVADKKDEVMPKTSASVSNQGAEARSSTTSRAELRKARAA